MEIKAGPHNSESVLLTDHMGHEFILFACPDTKEGREGFLSVNTLEEPFYFTKAQASAIAALLTRWVATERLSGGDEEE